MEFVVEMSTAKWHMACPGLGVMGSKIRKGILGHYKFLRAYYFTIQDNIKPPVYHISGVNLKCSRTSTKVKG